jgi:tetratricopeptide (TPR) repeat protein
MHRLLVATVAVLLLASPAAAQPRAHEPVDDKTGDVTPTTADEWLALGLSRYESGDWKGAVEAFHKGHELDPRPQFLFAIAQAERRRGNCKAAVVYYDRFLATSPPAEQEQAATTQLRRCEGVLAKEQLDTPKPEPTPVVALAPAPLPQREPDAPPWYTDGVTVATGGVSAALLLTGGAFYLAADGAATEAGDAQTYAEYADLKERAELRQNFAIVSVSVGAIVGGYAIYRIVRGRPARREAPERVHLNAGPGVGLAIGGRF